MDCRFLFIFVIQYFLCIRAGAQGIGVNYGLLGDNLPAPDRVVALLNSRGIQKVRIFDPNPDVLRALGNTDIEVVLGVRNQDLQQLATDPFFVIQWVSTNVKAYVPMVKFRYVSAGNEVIPGPLAKYVLRAMESLDAALKAAGFLVPVSTAIHFQVLGNSFPPSNGAFSDEAVSIMAPIVAFLASKQYPLLVNVYPYFAYTGNPTNIPLDYALGNVGAKTVFDGPIRYNNLFDAMIDAMYSALEKVGGQSVRIVASETGWPSAGNGNIATIANAQAYVNNVLARVTSQKGTPKRPGVFTETCIFALFNENLKPAGTEQHFGLYYPDMTQVYPVNIPV